MNQPPSVEAPEKVVGEAMARRIALGLIAAFILVVVCAFVDKAGRNRLEKAKETRVPASASAAAPTEAE
jgi:hypothetical protein